jgi:uncharacterized protein YjbJ (UPF0337 family)
MGGVDVTAQLGPVPVEERLRAIQSITDAALSRLDDRDLLAELLERTRDALQSDTAAVLLLDYSSGQPRSRRGSGCLSDSAWVVAYAAEVLRQEGTGVSATDKAKDKAEAAKGKVKKGTGKALDDPYLEGEGKAEEVKGNLKQAGEKVKDAFKK